jgi:hypothetical protein
MSTPETYYYGQGKVYLALRDAYGRALARRWVGDVSDLTVALSSESFTHKESYTTFRSPVRRLNTGNEATVTATWYEHSPANLAILLYGEQVVTPAGTVTGEALPAGIKAGERYTLEHQNVTDVEIGTLALGTDFTVDPLFGAIEFITEPTGSPTVSYSHASRIDTSMFTHRPVELALRYEGINMAEDGAPVIVELYKVVFDPASALNLINTDTSLPGLETTAGILLDTARPADAELGRYGRVTHVGSVA